MDHTKGNGVKRFGIFLGYGAHQPIRNEGLGRVLGFIIGGALERDDLRPTVACLAEFKPRVEELLQDHLIDVARVDWITTDEPPTENARRTKQPESRLNWIITGKMRKPQDDSYLRELEPTNLPLVARLRARRRHAREYAKLRRARKTFSGYLRMAWGYICFLAWELLEIAASACGVFCSKPNSTSLATTSELAPQSPIHLELEQLVCHINACEDIDAWLIPTLFWPEASGITRAKIVVCPDIVLHEFPSYFMDPTLNQIYSNLLQCVRMADRLICYSQHVKENHAVRTVGFRPERIEVIRHGKVDLSPQLSFENRQLSMVERREVAVESMRVAQATAMSHSAYWQEFNFDNTPYVVYTSQARPYKNILSLVKAIEHLSRRRHQDVRLVLTCNLANAPELQQYIEDRRLESIVMPLHNISSKTLAAVNALATIAVNPSLFEGGFPFTFSEAFSVGTPSLMSRIPVVEEVVTDEALRNMMLFDPYDLSSMIERIEWGLTNRQLLFQRQQELYDSLPTWKDSANRYVETLLQRNLTADGDS